MKGRRKRLSAPKRERRRTARPKSPAGLAVPPEEESPVGTTYETNVAPDLIEESRPPDRADDPQSECGLPAKYRDGPRG